MILRILAVLFVLLVPALRSSAQDAAAAHAQFEQLQNQWMDLERRYHDMQKANPEDKQLITLRRASDALLDQLTRTGLEVYRADPKAYPVVNQTLRAIANFHVVGDPNGDGGDQYEKALPLVKDLIDAGAAKDWPELWTLGAVSAYCTNDYPLAREYFAKAAAAGIAAISFLGILSPKLMAVFEQTSAGGDRMEYWPAVDIFQSGTRKEELLIPPKDLERITYIRRGLSGMNPPTAMGRVVEGMTKFPTNAKLLAQIK